MKDRSRIAKKISSSSPSMTAHLLQRRSITPAQTDEIPPIVEEVLQSPGQPLDANTRTTLGTQLGHDFSQVRVHQDEQAIAAANAIQAQAYTVGHNIVFAAGQYAPTTLAGRHLLAHELVHVVQQRQSSVLPDRINSSNSAAEVEADQIATQVTQSSTTRPQVATATPAQIARQPANPPAPTWGTAKTTAPVAALKPQTELLQPLTHEVALFQAAKVLLRWLKARLVAAKKAASGTTTTAPNTFTLNDLFSDAKLIKQVKPKPKSSADLQPAIDLLIHYGVVSILVAANANVTAPSSFSINIDPKTGEPDTTRLDEAEKKITAFTKAFERRIKRPSSLNPIVETEVLPKNMAAGSVKERKSETTAETELAKLEADKAKVEASNEDEDTKQKKLAAIEKEIESARKKLRTASGYHTFAKDVVNFLKRLHARNTKWLAGTYTGHSWGEFSVDIFLNASLVDVQMPDHPDFSGKYWKRAAVRQFFDDLNTTAEEEDPDTGKFAWRGIYNDVPLAQEINKKYGSGRVIQVPNHGPAPDHKLHIHLDLRPITLKWDKVRGYKIENGRVVILP